MNFKDKVILVTGSTSGIGKAIALSFASEGAKVAVQGRNETAGAEVVSQIRSNGGESIFLQGNLMDNQTPALLLNKIIEQWGKLDILVNSAAAVHHSVIGLINNEDWDTLFEINLKAPFFLIQESLPFLKSQNGSVINVSSLNAIKNTPNNIIYDSLKAALNHMTKGLAYEMKGSGVRFNAVMPAGTATPLLNKATHQQIDDYEEAERKAEESKLKKDVASTEQISDIVLYLASSKATWVNGSIIRADGGFHL